MSKAKTTLSILSCLLILGVMTTGALSAQGYPLARAQGAGPIQLAPSSSGNVALGLSYFIGATSGEPFEVITGYDQGLVYTATGDAVEVTDGGLMLRRNGTYRIHLEGVLALDDDDATADPGAAAIFTILIDGVPWVNCSTPSNTAAPTVAADWQFTADHERVASCKADFTIEVKGAGSDPGVFPVVFPRDSAVQAALVPNDLALGDATLMLTRIEISRVR